MAAATTSQLSCFSAMNRHLNLPTRSLLCPTILRPKSLSTTVMSLEGGSKTKTSLSYTSDAPKAKSDPILDDEQIAEPKRAAKIHDFCFGIPFGWIVLSGGLIGFIFSRNPATLSTGVLYGGALLALSTFSLKIWRQGKSSLPFILGQAALAAVLLWKHVQTYSLTKKVFPTGFYAVISAAMLCFYSYVLLSGGNPPPKKLKPSANGRCPTTKSTYEPDTCRHFHRTHPTSMGTTTREGRLGNGAFERSSWRAPTLLGPAPTMDTEMTWAPRFI
ncbi:hypothetical protein ACE6H2_007642 [Prunus campanulata]